VELVKTARKRSAASFVNAILRKIVAAAPVDHFAEISRSPDAAALSRNAAHPAWLVERWVAQYGLQFTRAICIQDQMVPSTAIHLPENVTDAELAASGVQLAPGQLLASARRVLAGDVTSTCAFREGRISIQDEASQLVAVLAGSGKPRLYRDIDNAILDCCAAPGSKTALMARRNPSANVFAMELHLHRARLLKSLNPLPNIMTLAADARRPPFSRNFDRILADVPCSGTGTLGRNPEIKWRLKPEDLRDLQVRQVAILKSALAHLAIGGRLVYSTCSLESEENKAVVEAALERQQKFNLIDMKVELEQLRKSGELASEKESHYLPSLVAGPYLRTIPGMHPCDGFFAAMIERTY
jgi:16S rRNA (cytosine967-C5)-methyltransferase